MADVYLALIGGPSGTNIAKLAVVKRLRSNLADDPEFVAMLVEEARIAARLNHPNVVQTQDVGLVDGEYFIAMEYLDGQPLHRVKRRACRAGRPLAREMEYLVIADALAGLHHAHELTDFDGTPLGIVHRDVTPQNIFVTYDGQVKVVDFGIAKAAGRANETREGFVKGKRRYMSPEQAMGRAVDRRSDLFSAGIMLWEAATRKRFWGELDDLAVGSALISGEYNGSPRSVDASVPEDIDAICRAALAWSPDKRISTADEFRFALEACVGADSIAYRRQLGPFVAELHTEQRRELRGVIEDAGQRALTSISSAKPRRTSTRRAGTSRAVPKTVSVSLSAPSKTVKRSPSAPPKTVKGALSAPPVATASAAQRRGLIARALLGLTLALALAVVGGSLVASGGSVTAPGVERMRAPAVVVLERSALAARLLARASPSHLASSTVRVTAAAPRASARLAPHVVPATNATAPLSSRPADLTRPHPSRPR